MTSIRLKAWPCELIEHDYLDDKPLALSGGKKADLVFADPPYNYGVKYEDDPTRDKMSLQEYKNFTARSIIDCASVARPGATFWWMTPEEHADWTGKMLTELVGERLYRIVWEESFAQYQGDRALTKDYRFIFCHVVRPEVGDAKDLLTWNPDAIRVPSARQLKYNDKRANSKGRVPGTTWRFSEGLSLEELADETMMLLQTADDQFAESDHTPDQLYERKRELLRKAFKHINRIEQMPTDIWKFRRLQGTSNDRRDWHPCQLPPELLERIIKGWSNPGDTVLDGFVGSGSMGRVARRLGRGFVGADRSRTYIEQVARELSVVDSTKEA